MPKVEGSLPDSPTPRRVMEEPLPVPETEAVAAPDIIKFLIPLESSDLRLLESQQISAEQLRMELLLQVTALKTVCKIKSI